MTNNGGCGNGNGSSEWSGWEHLIYKFSTGNSVQLIAMDAIRIWTGDSTHLLKSRLVVEVLFRLLITYCIENARFVAIKFLFQGPFKGILAEISDLYKLTSSRILWVGGVTYHVPILTSARDLLLQFRRGLCRATRVDGEIKYESPRALSCSSIHNQIQFSTPVCCCLIWFLVLCVLHLAARDLNFWCCLFLLCATGFPF